MPYFESVTLLSHPAARVFDFLSVPANLIEVTPPELNMRLVEAPERLYLGGARRAASTPLGFFAALCQ